MGEKLDPLKSPGNTQPGYVMWTAPADFSSLQDNATRVRSIMAVDAVKEARFPCTVGADNGAKASLFNSQGEIIQGRNPSKMEGQPSNIQQWAI
jgi:hypothetical protein